MKLKLACSDFTFPLLPHDDSLALIAMLGFEGADIGLFENRSHLWPSKEYRNPSNSGEKLRQRLADRGLRCADVFLQLDPDFVPYAINHPEPARRRKARTAFVKTLEYAAAAGSRHVTTLPGVYFKEEPRSMSWGRSCEELAWRLEQAKAHKLVFGIEGHVGSIAPKPAALERLVTSVPGLTLTLDCTHFTRIGLPDTDCDPLIPHASHFHVRGSCKGRLQASFDDNTIDYARILRLMRVDGYRGYLGVEYVWIDWEHCNEVDNLSETIRFRDYLRSQMK